MIFCYNLCIMASYYPHKLTALISVVCILAVLGTFAYTRYTETSKTTEATAVDMTSQENPAINASTDWKKQFSSGSSTSPLSTQAKKSAVVAPPENLTLTDKVGRNFLVGYVQLEQAGLIKDPAALQDAADYMIQNTVLNASAPRQYTAAQIHVTSDTVASVRAYGNEVGAAFATYSPRVDAANIAVEAYEKDDMNLLEGIDPIISGYQKTITALQSAPVPTSLTQQHLSLLNGLSSIVYVAQGLRNSEKDPMQAMIALGTYGAALNVLQSGLRDLKNYFTTNSISFAAGEPGASFSTI